MRTLLFCFILVFSLSALVAGQEKPSYRPNPKLTPGHALDLTRDDLCKSGYENPARKISITTKSQVFDIYGISANGVGYNVDYLIPVELGGSNSIRNLWPQPIAGEWSHYRKNKLEDRLRKMVCQGILDLKQARQEIAADWVSAYKKYVVESEQTPTAQHWWKRKAGT